MSDLLKTLYDSNAIIEHKLASNGNKYLKVSYGKFTIDEKVARTGTKSLNVFINKNNIKVVGYYYEHYKKRIGPKATNHKEYAAKEIAWRKLPWNVKHRTHDITLVVRRTKTGKINYLTINKLQHKHRKSKLDKPKRVKVFINSSSDHNFKMNLISLLDQIRTSYNLASSDYKDVMEFGVKVSDTNRAFNNRVKESKLLVSIICDYVDKYKDKLVYYKK